MMMKVETFSIVRDNYSAQGFCLRAVGPKKISPGRFFANTHLFFLGLISETIFSIETDIEYKNRTSIIRPRSVFRVTRPCVFFLPKSPTLNFLLLTIYKSTRFYDSLTGFIESLKYSKTNSIFKKKNWDVYGIFFTKDDDIET